MKTSEYKRLFLDEAQEILSSSNNILISFEKEPKNKALLDELFRRSHTLKSMAQSMGYDDIAKLTHSMETILALLRNEKLKPKTGVVELLFKSLDTLGDLLGEVREGKSKRVKVSPLIERLEKVSSALPKADEKYVEEKRKESKLIREKQGEAQTVRVPLAQLDGLMDLTGELVINRIRLARIAQAIENDELEETTTQMSRLTSQLQDKMMEVRLLPLEYLFTPYPRMIRDMASEQGKEVDFDIEGGHIGLDRSIQDEINEPLLHLLKNAVVHGIERPGEREKRGKLKRGKIKLVARREKNFVTLELSDDGRGIDINEVKEVALKKGIITREELSALAPEELLMLITSPGYSRSKEVTEAAGRGMGLNASKLKVESFGGNLSIKTKPNEGTVISIKLPLTMAIMKAILVGIDNETYCIPLSYVVETIKISTAEVRTMEGCEVTSYRDTVLPLIQLRRKFGFSVSGPELSSLNLPAQNSAIPIVVVEAGSRKAGLVVDRLIGQQEAVIKPLTGIMKEIKGASGATILDTGKVALIVDVSSLL
jgi:two-component system chemotaxis sensor kinase CheA